MLCSPPPALRLPPSLYLPPPPRATPFRSFRVSLEEDQAGRVFVAGASGNTGKSIVKELLARGFKVRAGVRDLTAASKVLPADENIELVQADVTEGAEKLATAIGNVESVVCATGFRRSFDFLAPWKVDNFGTVNLVDACKKKGIKRFVLISSILVNGAAMGQVLNPAYIVLNVLGLTLIAKLQAENYIRRSGINYTIVRPGGLTSSRPSGNIVMAPEDTLYEGSISRDSVANIAVEALMYPEASYKCCHMKRTIGLVVMVPTSFTSMTLANKFHHAHQCKAGGKKVKVACGSLMALKLGIRSKRQQRRATNLRSKEMTQGVFKSPRKERTHQSQARVVHLLIPWHLLHTRTSPVHARSCILELH